MNEIWRPIYGYESLYEVSNLGRIRSYHGKKKSSDGFIYLNPTPTPQGYLVVTLYKNGKRSKKTVHTLVAEAFIQNPNNYPCVNHKDENKQNNFACNLEWCTYAYNNAYGTAKIRSINTKSKPVNQFTLQGTWIATYLSARVANKLTNIPRSDIQNCCKGKIPYAGGYIWSYVTPNKKSELLRQNPINQNNHH